MDLLEKVSIFALIFKLSRTGNVYAISEFIAAVCLLTIFYSIYKGTTAFLIVSRSIC